MSTLATMPSEPLAALDGIADLVAALKQRAPHLVAHASRTARYAVRLGQALALSETDLQHLHLAALLHDLGWLTLPPALLNQDRPLTPEEDALAQASPRAGAELLAPFPGLETPALWIAHHHERWDGLGYPYGLRGPFIPLGARILAVADTFDQLQTPWQPGPVRTLQIACRLLLVLAGTQLDPDLVTTFVHLPNLATVVSHCHTAPALPLTGALLECEVACASTSPGGRAFVPPGPRPPSFV
jgi:HD-GYP domain-containing protein (c-di-GMP phosphodiesterase class II)